MAEVAANLEPSTGGRKLALGDAIDGLFDGDPAGAVFARRLSEFVMALTNARSVVVFDQEITHDPVATLGTPGTLENERQIARGGLEAAGVLVVPPGRFGVLIETYDGSRFVLSVTLPSGNDVLASLAYERLEMIRALCRMWANGQGKGLPPQLLNNAAQVASGRWDLARQLVDGLAGETGSSCGLVLLSKRRVRDLVVSGQESVSTRAPLRADYDRRIAAAFLNSAEATGVHLLGGQRPTHALVLESPERASALAPALSAIFRAAVPERQPLFHLKTLLKPALVVAAIVAAGFIPVGDNINLPATVSAVSERIVTAPFDGRLEALLVEEGEKVSAGETLLLTMDSRRLKVDMAEAREALSAAITRQDNARGRARAADLKEAEIDVRRANLKIESLGYRLASAEVTAPITGLIQAEDLSSMPGSYLGLGAEIMRIVDPATLRLTLEVSPRARGRLMVGASGTFRPDASPDQTFDLSVQSIAVAPTEGDGQISYRAKTGELAPAVDFQLRPGMQGVARFELENLPLGQLLWRRLRDWALLTFWI